MEQGTEISLSTAQKTHDVIVQIKKGIHESFLSLAVCLKMMKTKEYYIELGFNTFEEYCQTPEVDLTVNRCNKLIRIYNRWVEDYGYEVKELEGIDTECLDIAQSQATSENYEEWLERARVLSRADLRALTPGTVQKKLNVYCPNCGKVFEVNKTSIYNVKGAV